MAREFKTGEEYYNRIYLLFNLFIAATLLPFGYLLLLKQSAQLRSTLAEPWLTTLTIGLLMASIAITYQSQKRFALFLKEIDQSTSLRNKLTTYRSHSVKKYLGFMLAGMICVSGFYLTVNTIFVIAYIITIILLSIKRPTLNTFADDLGLSQEENQILIDNRPIPED